MTPISPNRIAVTAGPKQNYTDAALHRTAGGTPLLAAPTGKAVPTHYLHTNIIASARAAVKGRRGDPQGSYRVIDRLRPVPETVR
jgi:hypothetical protein